MDTANSGLSRREVLGGLAALGVSALLGPGRAAAQTAARPRVINVHHHLIAPGYLKFLNEVAEPGGEQPVKSPPQMIEEMDKAGIDVCICSTSRRASGRATRLPRGGWPARVQRVRGEGGVRLSGALRHVRRAPAARYRRQSSRDRVRPGHAEGGRRVHVHELGRHIPVRRPVSRRSGPRADLRRAAAPPGGRVYASEDAVCCRGIIPGVTGATIEYPMDTTRTIMSLLATGTAARYPDVKFIFAHAGGATASLVGRMSGEGAVNLQDGGVMKAGTPAASERLRLLQKFYYDTAGAANPATLGALRRMVPVSQILFGNDYPFGTAAEQHRLLVQSGVFSDAELRAISSGNIGALLPRYRTA